MVLLKKVKKVLTFIGILCALSILVMFVSNKYPFYAILYIKDYVLFCSITWCFVCVWEAIERIHKTRK